MSSAIPMTFATRLLGSLFFRFSFCNFAVRSENDPEHWILVTRRLAWMAFRQGRAIQIFIA